MSSRRTRKTASSASSRRWRNARLVLWVLIICLAIALLLARTPRRGEIRQPAPPPDETVSQRQRPPAPATPAAETSPTEAAWLIEDDGRTMWVSPTEGPALALSYLPPGAQVIVALRHASLLEHPEGEKVFDSLGPLGQRGMQSLDDTLPGHTGIEHALIGVQATSDGVWQTALVVRLSGGRAAAERVIAALPGAVERRHDRQSYWLAAGGRAYYLPDGDKAPIVIAPEESIAEVIDLAGQPPPLRRDAERLLAHTDADRHVSILFAPNFLFSEGASMFAGAMAGLRGPLFWFLGDEFSAAALSLHWDESFFVELMATPTLDTTPERAARILAARISEVPERIEEHIVGLTASPYGRRVVARVPVMLRRLAAYTRDGFESDRVVMRCYLPASAGHNLLLGAELTLAESLGDGRVADAGAPLAAAAAKAPAQSVQERLQQVTSLRFSRDTLETALELLADDIGAEIVIQGTDLQTEGITKNQSFGIDVQDKPAQEILVEILRLANPDKSAAGPGDPRQRLVYVVDASGGAEQIIVTTRARAAERGDRLPPIFQQP